MKQKKIKIEPRIKLNYNIYLNNYFSSSQGQARENSHSVKFGLPPKSHEGSQLYTSVSVKSGGYFPHRFVARQISTTVHLRFGE